MVAYEYTQSKTKLISKGSKLAAAERMCPFIYEELPAFMVENKNFVLSSPSHKSLDTSPRLPTTIPPKLVNLSTYDNNNNNNQTSLDSSTCSTNNKSKSLDESFSLNDKPPLFAFYKLNNVPIVTSKYVHSPKAKYAKNVTVLKASTTNQNKRNSNCNEYYL